jgi:iron complex outermembrane receptor protein
MKFIALFLLIILLNISAAAQNYQSSITGTVISTEGNPVELVNISIEGTNFGSYTDKNGKFEISNLNPGIYTMKVSSVGYRTKEIQVILKSGNNMYPDIILERSANELAEIIVNADKINKFGNPQSDYIAKLPVKDIENPQSYSSATPELLNEQNIVEYTSALSSIPGGNISSENAAGITGIFIRGFLTNSFIKNGVYSFSPDGGDPQVIERIELIRGPSGPVYGTWGIGYGGLINRVTKKPFKSHYYSAGMTLGSFNLQRYYGDVNLPLNEANTLLMRVNAAVHSEGSFQDYGYKKTSVIAPVFLFKPNDDFSILVEAEFNKIDLSANTLFGGAAGLGKSSIKQIKTDYFKSYSSEKLTHPPTVSNNYYSRIDYKLSGGWMLTSNFAVADYSNYGSIVIPMFINDSLLSRRIYDFNGDINTFDVQPEITGSFLIGKMKNRFLGGFDYQWVDVISSASIILTADTLNYRQGITPVLNAAKLRSRYDLSIQSDESRNSYSVYANDIISLTDKLDVMLGLRYDYMDYNGTKNLIAGTYNSNPFNKGTFSPQAGISYQLINDQLSVFGNYMQGFNYITSNIQGQSFDPEFANQIEGGIKANLFNNRFSSTLSYYDIKVSNKVRKDPSNPLLAIQDGSQLSRGVDADIRTNPVTGLNILLGYSYNSSKFEKADPSLEGKRPLGVPEHMATLWISYSIQSGILSGLGIGSGLNYSSDYFYDDLNTLTIPSFAVIKASIFYNNVWLRMNLTIDNLTDKRYWDYNGSPQMPERILFNIMFNI